MYEPPDPPRHAPVRCVWLAPALLSCGPATSRSSRRRVLKRKNLLSLGYRTGGLLDFSSRLCPLCDHAATQSARCADGGIRPNATGSTPSLGRHRTLRDHACMTACAMCSHPGPSAPRPALSPTSSVNFPEFPPHALRLHIRVFAEAPMLYARLAWPLS